MQNALQKQVESYSIETVAPAAPSNPEPPADAPIFLTFAAAAKRLGVAYYQVQRAARTGLLPTYKLHSGRRLLKFAEVLEVIEASREGGGR